MIKLNCKSIKKTIASVQWEFLLDRIPNPNAQVNFLNKTILIIVTNFIKRKRTQVDYQIDLLRK